MLWSGNNPLRLKIRPVRVFHDGINVLRAGRAGLEMMRAFADAPAVIAALGDKVNFLPQILPDIADPQVAGLAVEAVAPRIAQAIGENFLARAVGHVWFVGRTDCRTECRMAIPAHASRHRTVLRVFTSIRSILASKRGGVLAVAERIVRRAAVAETEIKITVRAESQFTALVIPERLRHVQKNAFGIHVGLVRIGRRTP